MAEGAHLNDRRKIATPSERRLAMTAATGFTLTGTMAGLRNLKVIYDRNDVGRLPRSLS